MPSRPSEGLHLHVLYDVPLHQSVFGHFPIHLASLFCDQLEKFVKPASNSIVLKVNLITKLRGRGVDSLYFFGTLLQVLRVAVQLFSKFSF